VTERKYSVASIVPDRTGFYSPTLRSGGFKVTYETQDVEVSGRCL